MITLSVALARTAPIVGMLLPSLAFLKGSLAFQA
jgi:hypothetical protein